jgi:hypothetical protein
VVALVRLGGWLNGFCLRGLSVLGRTEAIASTSTLTAAASIDPCGYDLRKALPTLLKSFIPKIVRACSSSIAPTSRITTSNVLQDSRLYVDYEHIPQNAIHDLRFTSDNSSRYIGAWCSMNHVNANSEINRLTK